jgi:hypothetical protein
MDTITELPVREAKVAGKLAERSLNELLTVASTYPASYDRERIVREADVILDAALAESERICARFPELEPVVWTEPRSVLDDQGEFAPRIR